MAAADQLGAAAAGRKLGPYWRRKTGTTLPGERAGQQLQRLNILRKAMGLPLVGGAVGDADTGEGAGPGGAVAGAPGMPGFLAAAQARSMAPVPEEGAGPGGNVAGAADPAAQWRQVLSTLHAEANPGHPFNPGGPNEGEQVDPGFNLGGINQGGVRGMILQRLQGLAPQRAATSRQALQHHVMQLMQKQGKRAILPHRQPLGSQGAGPGGRPY